MMSLPRYFPFSVAAEGLAGSKLNSKPREAQYALMIWTLSIPRVIAAFSDTQLLLSSLIALLYHNMKS